MFRVCLSFNIFDYRRRKRINVELRTRKSKTTQATRDVDSSGFALEQLNKKAGLPASSCIKFLVDFTLVHGFGTDVLIDLTDQSLQYFPWPTFDEA